MKPFWRRVNNLIGEHDEDIWHKRGYLEILADGNTYRSIYTSPWDSHITWISWEPFGMMGHFSSITDRNASIRWVSTEGK